MAKYIDKDDLEAFLNELRDNLGDSDYDMGYLCAIDSIFGCYLNSIDVKEVDLDKEFENYMDKYNGVWVDSDYIRFAKHFFELGLKVNQDVDLELIVSWFDHITQIADDRKTANGVVMVDWAALDEIKCLAKESSEFIKTHYKAQKGE